MYKILETLVQKRHIHIKNLYFKNISTGSGQIADINLIDEVINQERSAIFKSFQIFFIFACLLKQYAVISRLIES